MVGKRQGGKEKEKEEEEGWENALFFYGRSVDHFSNEICGVFFLFSDPLFYLHVYSNSYSNLYLNPTLNSNSCFYTCSDSRQVK